ncbi:MAG: cysteine synthase family protein, partial [Thermoleophilia bacterium]|nr:cysteine synthase family protein [Thermoleophilia bacterium]
GAGVISAIGKTPLVDVTLLLDRDETPAGVRLFAKLESANPSGSVKDRVALSMITQARASGALQPGQTLLEPTSGNTGISLAMIGRVLGHPLRAVMPANVTPERVSLLNLFGAEVIFSPPELGSNGSVRMAQEIASDDASLFMPLQYENPANPDAHYHGTAPEIIEQVGGTIATFVAGLGTGGTLMGVGRRLREQFPDVQIVAAEPKPGDSIMGLRSLDAGYIPPVLDATKLDRRILVGNAASVAGTRELTRAGIFAGVSAGAALTVAKRVARQASEGDTIVMLVADSGWKYLSAGIWDARDEAQLEADMEAGHWW